MAVLFSEVAMHLCYIDESGDSQALPNATSSIQPLLAVCALLIDADKVKPLTGDFIALKRQFFPKRFDHLNHELDVLIHEIKGSDIRTAIRKNHPRSQMVRHHFKFLDRIVDLLIRYNIRIVGRIWIKEIAKPLDDRSVYTSTTQYIAERFQGYLEECDQEGMMIADFRDPKRNSWVAHSIFTRKHKRKGGDALPNINETAVFGISDNHACLQIIDLLCTAVIVPSAARVYCHPSVNNVHTHSSFDRIHNRFKSRLQKLQFHCKRDRYMKWGITVKDPFHGRNGAALFK